MASVVIEREMYAGTTKLVHNPNARGRAPRYVATIGEEVTKPKGVTSILGAVLAKDLMQWAADMAVDFLRDKLPVITEADLLEAKDAYKTKRDKGANTGTEAHKLVEDFLKGAETIKGITPSVEARNAFGAFKKWFNSVKPTVINVEEVIYSQEFKFAGTYDCMLEVDGKVYLCDLKTTNSSRQAPNGVYAENFVQLGAYALAHEEQRSYEDKNGGTNLLPIDGLMVISCKKDGKLDVVTNDDLGLSLDDCQTMFKRVVNLYNFMQYTKQALGGV